MVGLSLLAASLSAAPASAGEPIFVPDFTATTGDEFAVSVMLQGFLADRLAANGYLVLTGEAVGAVLGGERVVTCATRPGCPADVLPKIPTQVAVVVAVTRTSSGLVGTARLYVSGSPEAQPGTDGLEPIDELFLPIEAGNEFGFALAISDRVDQLRQELGPSSEEVVAAAMRMIAGETPPDDLMEVDRPAPAPPPVAVVPRPPPAPRPLDTVDPHSGSLADILDGTGYFPRHVAGAEADFRMSGLSPREWSNKSTPHAGRVAFEVRAGMGFGDVDRSADVRVQTRGGVEDASWYAEGPTAGRRVRGDLYLGYAPLAALDVGVLAGLQYGHRQVATSAVALGAGGEVLLDEQFPVQDVQAVQVYVQPRLRVYLVPLGPVKPYVVTGADFRMFDDYQIVQPASVSYPQPIGGVIPGWHGGGGLMIDPSPVVGAFVEGGYTRHFGPFAATQQRTVGAWTQPTPEPAATQQFTVSVVGGLQFRL